MKPVTYPNGSKLRLIPHTTLWAQAWAEGRADLIYEVVAQIDDGTTMERIALRAYGETGLAWHGITPGLFAPAST